MAKTKALALAGLVVAMSGLGVACKGGAGDSCSSNDDCNSSLICQPIEGRNQDYCCPAPATESSEANCHPVTPTAPPAGTATSPPAADAAPPPTMTAPDAGAGG